MLTKTKTYEEEKNDLEINHSFSIPEDILNSINERWFYLYEWIWVKDVKNSIERDFLKYIKNFWIILAVILIIPSAILFFAIWPLFIVFFLLLLWIINLIFIVILTILAIKRSHILRKNANVLLTNSYISINWNIERLGSMKSDNYNQIQKISELFEEKIFENSNIENTKKSFFKQVLEEIWSGYWKIMRIWNSRSKNSSQIMLLLFALYTIYALSLWLIYSIWIFFIWIFWNVLSFINKKILLISWHKVTSINNNFEYIDEYSEKLINEKNNLSVQLKEATNNDWKDWLLNKINDWLENINKYADDSIKTYIKLKHEIDTSEYNEMFNYSVYNSWIKKQILTPLEQILDLLNKNLNILKQSKESIEKQILETSDPSLKWPIIASKTRIEMKIEEIEKHIERISLYAEKLR